MIRLNIAPHLKGKSKTDLMHDLRVSYATAHKLYTGNMTAITFDVLARLCTTLGVTPNDLLILDPKGKRK